MAAQIPYPQRLAQQLDALVAAHVAGDPTDEIAQELATAWSEYESAVMTFSGAQLAVGKQVVLRGSSAQSPWLLPASMAGIRSIKPTGALSAADVAGLAGALAKLENTHESLANFSMWVWAGGAAGFDVHVTSSLLDRTDALAPVEGARQSLDSGRAQRAQKAAVQFAMRRQRRDILLQQAEEQLNHYVQALASGQLTLRQDAAQTLRQQAENGGFWASQLVSTTTANDALLAAFSPTLAARWVLDGFGAGPSLDAMDAIASLQAEPPETTPADGEKTDEEGDAPTPAQEWLTGLLSGVSDQDLGRAVGRTLPLNDAAIARLSTMMRDVSLPFSAGVATGVLERAGGGEAAVKEVADVCQKVGLRQLWSHADLKGLSEPVARGIAVVLKLADAGAEFYADLVLASPASVAAWILRNAPANVRSRIESRLHHLFASREPTENLPLIEALIATGSQGSIRALADVFVQSKGNGWVGQMVPDLCAAILQKGLGGEFLVPLFRDREADTKLRLLVLRGLEGRPELLAEAVKFRPSDLVEPKEIQARLKAARKRLKEG